MDWYYDDNGKPVGPISEQRLSELVRFGTIGLRTPVWRPGLQEWMPLASLEAEIKAVELPTSPLRGSSVANEDSVSLAELVQEERRRKAEAAEADLQAERKRQAEAKARNLQTRQEFCARWNSTLVKMLSEAGEVTWGKGSFNSMSPSLPETLEWFVVRACGKEREWYCIAVPCLSEFNVVGTSGRTAQLTEESLRTAMLEVCLLGPAKGQLPKSIETLLTKIPYANGESDTLNWWIGVPTVVQALLGFFLLFAASRPYQSNPLAVIASSVVVIAGVVFISVKTELFTRFRRLAGIDKAWVIIATLPGAASTLYLSVGCVLCIAGCLAVAWALNGFSLSGSGGSASLNEKRVAEIEEGVRRAMDK